MTRSRRSSSGRELPTHPLVARAAEQLVKDRQLLVVKAPPGAGKTTLLLGVLRELLSKGLRLAVATQTNSQADDLCDRWTQHGLGPITRFMAGGDVDPPSHEDIQIIQQNCDIPTRPCVVVATSSKWTWVRGFEPFDVLLVDEAWQMSWASFAGLPHVAGSFLLIGDPGQIQPIVTVDVSRWEGSPVPPHWSAPQVLLHRGVGEVRSLDCTYRLPADTAEVVQGFYDFAFTAKSKHGERRLLVEHKRGSGAIGQMLAAARETTMLAGVRAMPKHGSVPDDDPEIAADAGAVVRQLLESRAKVDIDGRIVDLDPSQIGVCATHRVMLSSIRERMPRGSEQVRIDTPERWQGLERPVMVVVHPLSSTTAPSEFDMGTGRLCVMSSRHKAALVVLSRDHVPQTLMENLPDATQAPNCVDAVGRSHSQQTRFWGSLAREGSMFRLEG